MDRWMEGWMDECSISGCSVAPERTLKQCLLQWVTPKPLPHSASLRPLSSFLPSHLLLTCASPFLGSFHHLSLWPRSSPGPGWGEGTCVHSAPVLQTPGSCHLSAVSRLNHQGSHVPTCPVMVQCISVAQLCLTPCDPMGHVARQASLSTTSSWSLLKLMCIESVMPSNHLILCRPLLLPPSIFPSIRVFYNELALRIRWPEYWSFNFNISPSNDQPGLISFSMDWLDRLAVQGTLKSLLQHHS